jgi:ABC-type lipoprotein export system ATPase subunit
MLGTELVRAVDDVSLTIAAGEAVAVLGPSGSGKSTLMHLIGGLERPSAGTVRVAGVDLAQLDGAEAAAYRGQHVGFVFQQFHLQPHLTALENVELPLRLAGLGPTERRQRASELLERVGLADRMQHRPGQLSGGQQQRVSIARALANRPQLLLADEPTGNLDTATGTEVLALFDRLRREDGLTLVLVTHDAEVATRLDRIVRMRDGKIIADERRPESGEAQRGTIVPRAIERAARARLRDVFCDAARGLARQRLRATLTAFGIAIGAMAIALMVGLGYGLHEFIVDQANSINDPLSLWVTNSSFSVSDLVGNRAQQLGAPPAPLAERSLARLAQARAGFEPFDDEQIAALRSIEGVVDVRPRSYVILDGIRLVAQGAEQLDVARPSASDRQGPPELFSETFYVGYTLVRTAGAQLRIHSGRTLEDRDLRGVVVSFQYAEAWGVSPAALVGREVELLFPSLGEYADFNFVMPQQVEPRYRGYRARIIGVTTKSVLSSGVILPPTFGEEVTSFQFDRGQPDEDGVIGRLAELVRLARSTTLQAQLAAAGGKAAELGALLAPLARGSQAGRIVDPSAAMMVGMQLTALMARARELLADPATVTQLEAAGPESRRLLELLRPLLALPSAAESNPQRQWGSRVRVNVRGPEWVAPVKLEIARRGLKVQSLQDGLEMVGRVFAVVDAFLSSFGVIALIVAALGIANTLFMAVVERTREIGVMKAVGASEGRIRLLFALEAMLIGLLGGIGGVALACLAGWVINHHAIARIAPDWRGIAFFASTVFISSIIALLAGLWPAHRAARLDPIAALRSE